MIVLTWLRKEPMDLKTFVQNRVAKIQELYNQLWRHVPSDQNPADLVSRGVDPDKLLQQNLWFNGPTFLSVTRAVHLELVSDMSTKCFLLALRRFLARRGNCKVIYSDNARTFKAAERELAYFANILKDSEFQNFVADKEVEVIVNHRPLTYVENDPGEAEQLTPSP
ncbi:integrase catalytic domain-containing protein [Trichonephila clavipes]|nr:integrase catalytic domain-containing protein [Trichonephila clavipes]